MKKGFTQWNIFYKQSIFLFFLLGYSLLVDCDESNKPQARFFPLTIISMESLANDQQRLPETIKSMCKLGEAPACSDVFLPEVTLIRMDLDITIGAEERLNLKTENPVSGCSKSFYKSSPSRLRIKNDRNHILDILDIPPRMAQNSGPDSIAISNLGNYLTALPENVLFFADEKTASNLENILSRKKLVLIPDFSSLPKIVADTLCRRPDEAFQFIAIYSPNRKFKKLVSIDPPDLPISKDQLFEFGQNIDDRLGLKDTLSISTGEEVNFWVKPINQGGYLFSYSWKVDNKDVRKNTPEFTWLFDKSNRYEITVEILDPEGGKWSHLWYVVVMPSKPPFDQSPSSEPLRIVSKKPDTEELSVAAGAVVKFEIHATGQNDYDLSYNWSVDNNFMKSIDKREFSFTFPDTGIHLVTVKLISPHSSTETTWRIHVQDWKDLAFQLITKGDFPEARRLLDFRNQNLSVPRQNASPEEVDYYVSQKQALGDFFVRLGQASEQSDCFTGAQSIYKQAFRFSQHPDLSWRIGITFFNEDNFDSARVWLRDIPNNYLFSLSVRQKACYYMILTEYNAALRKSITDLSRRELLNNALNHQKLFENNRNDSVDSFFTKQEWKIYDTISPKIREEIQNLQDMQ